MSEMLTSLHGQGAAKVICDPDFYAVDLPPAMKADYISKCEKVTEVIVTGQAGSSELFPNAKVTSVDPNIL